MSDFVTLTVTIRRDPVPGAMHTRQDVAKSVQRALSYQLGHYEPTVELAKSTSDLVEELARGIVIRDEHFSFHFLLAGPDGRLHRVTVHKGEQGDPYDGGGWELADIPVSVDGLPIAEYAMAIHQEGMRDILQGARSLALEYLRHTC